VTTLNAVGRNVAVVLNQGVEQNKFAGAPATLAAEHAAVEAQA